MTDEQCENFPSTTSTANPSPHVSYYIQGDVTIPSQPDTVIPCLRIMEQLRRNAMRYVGVNNCPVELGRPIERVTLQINSEVRQSNDYGHYNKREEIVKIYQAGQGDVFAHQLFARAEERARANMPEEIQSEVQIQRYIKQHSNVIALSGQAGMGKTTISQILTECVLEGKALPNTKYYFNVSFREVDYDHLMSLWDFLTYGYELTIPLDAKSKEKLINMIHLSEDVFITLDGLDEAVSEEIHLLSPKIKLHQLAKPIHFAKNLLSRELLPKAKVFLTSRPYQLYNLNPKYRPYFIAETLGLDEESQQNIIKQICGEEKCRDVIACLMEFPELRSLCCVPVNCLLVVCCLFKMLHEENKINVRTITGVMAYALFNYLKSDHIKDFKQCMSNISKLCTLAWNGIENGQVLFTMADFIQCGMDSESVDAFLHTCIDSKSKLRVRILDGEKRMSFSHLVWQEFFAAILLMLFMPLDDFKKLLPRLKSLRYEIVLKFCFGFCYAEVQEQLRRIFHTNTIMSEKKQLLKEMAKQCAKSSADVAAVCGWAKEARCPQITKAVAESLCLPGNKLDITNRTILPTGASSIKYVIENSPCSFSVDFSGSNFIRNAFSLFVSTVISIEIEEVSCSAAESKPSGSKSYPSRIKRFPALHRNNLNTPNAPLKQQFRNKIEVLKLRGCKLTCADVSELKEKLQHLKIRIKDVDLSFNEIGDHGALLLMEVLGKFKRLDIGTCRITKDVVERLKREILQMSDPKPDVRGWDARFQFM